MERLENEKEPGGPYDFLTKNPEYIRALSEVCTRFDLASLSGLACVKLCFTFIYRISPRLTQKALLFKRNYQFVRYFRYFCYANRCSIQIELLKRSNFRAGIQTIMQYYRN